jgi:hypothetical protein
MIWSQSGRSRARISDVATYEWTTSSITCYPHPDALPEKLTITLFGTILSWWLEGQGLPNIHASAVMVKGRGIAFIATNKGGKSTLAATLMQAGHQLLTDDILALEHRKSAFIGHPSYPQMRLWPDQASHFFDRYQSFSRVHPEFSKLRIPVGPGGFGSFATGAHPLGCFYLPERRDPEQGWNEVQISQVSPRDAVIELIRHSFSARITEALGYRPQRLDFFDQLVRQVPMRRLVYPSGFEHLPAVRDAVLSDIQYLLQ